MASRSEALGPRCFVCAAAVCIVGWLLLSGGCPIFVPVSTDQSGSSTSQPSGDQTNGTGSTSGQNTGGTGSGQTGGTGGNTSGSNTGNTGGSGSSGGTGGSGGTNGGTGGSNENTGGGNGGGSGGGGSPNFTQFSYQQIAQIGTQAPGQPNGVTFTDLGNPVIDSQGRVAFWALYDGAGKKGFGGLYVWDGSTLKRVLDDDPASAGVVPGRTTQDYFGQFGGTGVTSPLTLDLTWAGGDRLLFISPVSGQKSSRGFYRWRATDANFARIADLEQIVALFPDAVPNGFSPTFVLPGVSDAGFAIFGVSYTYLTKPPNSNFVKGRGVFTSNGTAVSIIADTVQSQGAPGHVPDQGANAFFTFVGTLTTLNGAGSMLFEGQYDGGNGTRGVYLWNGTAAYRVIDNRSGASWPGLPAGAQVDPASKAYDFAIGPAGHIALHTTIQAGGNTHDAVLLWDQGAATWKELTGANGAPATALLSAASNDGQVLLLSDGNPYLASANGQTQVNATLPAALQGVSVTWATAGGAINNGDRTVVPYTRGSATGLMYWTGQSALLVADGAASLPAAGISGISTITDVRRDRPGRSGLLNDHDQVVFLATFTAGGKTVYLATAQ